MSRRTTPVRTCVGCRQRAASSDLIRVVADGGEVVVDTRRRLAGRGAHLHPDAACLGSAERRRAFPRALRVPGPLDTAALHDVVAGVSAEVGAPRTARQPVPTPEAGPNAMSAR